MAERVSADEVIAYRLAAHGLTERLDDDGTLEAAGRCAIQNSPPGSALLALHARVRSVAADRVDTLVADDKSLLQTWSLRGAPFYFPTVDAAVFTTGVLPPAEDSLRHFIVGVEQSVDRLGMTVTDAVDLCGAEIGDVLAGRRLAITELGAELAHRIGCRLPPKQRTVWDAEGPHAQGQPVGEAVVHFCLRILTLQQVVCLTRRDGNKAPFALVDDWIGRPVPDTDPQTARAELLRRYLRCYGPSTRAHFAGWLGIRAGDVDPWWDLVADEMTPVDFGGPAWILTDDRDALRSPPDAAGVRLLPPRDPYTQMRDRETIVERRYHRDVWKNVGEPGMVLVDGTIAGAWRPRKRGRTLTLTISTFAALPARHQRSLQHEAEAIAPLRGADAAAVEFDTW
ncbi:winged helix DNA-binding domain-containing protein [Gordonia sp. SL306]|uniref:winged helix DNA-binding domain-containing protein n=1 Tax=Gordonia sp. SL306 TaxID=2995145 RepID=UPI0022701F24|nr:winged helix DNA-binding domain-containing protein [Gordonia sp. SL306]WAC55932.1 winged helix DNA-binding domain-containing protein [Gordonia sp. SL306]